MYVMYVCMYLSVYCSLFFISCSGPRVPGIDPSPAVFGVVKRITDQDVDAHTNQQVYSTVVLILIHSKYTCYFIDVFLWITCSQDEEGWRLHGPPVPQTSPTMGEE